MSNNITLLENELKQQATAEALAYAEDFSKYGTLTDKEKELLNNNSENQVVVTEVGKDGNRVSVPLSEYAAPLDSMVTEIGDVQNAVRNLVKTVNTGDVKRSVSEIKQEAQDKAIRAFRELTITDKEMDDLDIIAVNNAGLAALQKYLGVERINFDAVAKRLYKLTLTQFAEFLPPEFMNIYTTERERRLNSIKAKERLLASIAYLVTTGPEMDYLNDYIDNQHRLITVSQQLMQCRVDFMEMVKNPKELSKIAAEAALIEPADTSVWSQYIRDPKHVHNIFAQKAVIFAKYKDAYLHLLEEYKDHADSCAIIQEQIDECDAKYEVYRNVLHLDLMRELSAVMVDRFKTNTKRNGYKNLVREAIAALDRIRRSPQNVPFPVYNEKLVKRPEELFKLYMDQYPKMIEQYNNTLFSIKQKQPEKTTDTNIEYIAIDGKFKDTVAQYFSLLLLILYGRIMKKLTKNNMTKYDAIMLDAYFECYCKMGTDIYLMNDVWLIMKDFVSYAIDTWPNTGK